MVWFSQLVLLLVAFALGAPSARAQTNHACQILTAAEAKALMGIAMAFKGEDESTCKYEQTGFADKAPNNRTIWLSIYARPKPNPNAVTDQLDNFKRYYSPPPVSITSPTDIGDAALWAWRGDVGGELYAYSGGSTEVQVWIKGLSQLQAYSAARSLAMKTLGSAGRTGFAYAGAPQPTVANAPRPLAPVIKPAPAPASPPAPAASSNRSRYADAPFVGANEFFRALKEVDLHALQQLSALSSFLPEEKITSILTDELSRYGIRTREGAPVVLQVIVGDDDYTVRGGGETVPIHAFQVEIRFLVPAVALRNGRLVGVVAAPAASLYSVGIEEDNSVRKLFLGDRTKADFENQFTSFIRGAFNDFANDHLLATDWPVSKWTEQQKTAAQDGFKRALASVGDTASAKRRSEAQFSGLDLAPKLTLHAQMSGPACRANEPTWRAVFDESVRKHGLVRETNPPELLLTDTFACEYESGNTTWYQVSDILMMTEANVAYVLNGRIVRGWGTIAASVRTHISLEKDIDDLMSGYSVNRAAEIMAVN
jgi:hypothetical protein